MPQSFQHRGTNSATHFTAFAVQNVSVTPGRSDVFSDKAVHIRIFFHTASMPSHKLPLSVAYPAPVFSNEISHT